MACPAGSGERELRVAHTMSQSMGQFMRLEQRLTPQLIQSMDILQLSAQDLELRIAEELEKNVTLELADPAPSAEEAEGQSRDDNQARVDGDSESFSRLDRFARENRLEFEDSSLSHLRGRYTGGGERDSKLDAMANTAGRSQGLDEHLLQQWVLLDLDDETRRAGETIIYHLNEDGYLKTSLEQVAENCRPAVSADVLERALARVQRLEPVGIAARDYRECLLLQLETLPGDNEIERRLIADHLEDIGKNRLPVIAAATGFSLGEITSAIEVITHSLLLYPAYQVVEKRIPRVFPDVIVEEELAGKGLMVRLTRGNLPDLRIKQEYLDMLKARSNGKEVREFVRKQVENAGTLIEAIKFRKSRLMEVAQAIVTHQPEFFEVGPSGLKVFRMSDLADELGCDPSTISRSVADKFMETPYGVLPMRYFFTGGTESGDAAGTSWDSIKQRVAQIIKEEDPKDPLNDDQITELLAKEDIPIKRRTVAKYRSQLDIPPARQRRQF